MRAPFCSFGFFVFRNKLNERNESTPTSPPPPLPLQLKLLKRLVLEKNMCLTVIFVLKNLLLLNFI